MNIRTTFVDIGNFLYYCLLEKELKNCGTVIDLGCGNKSPLGKIKKNFRSEGIDIYRKSIEESKRKGLHDSYKIADIKNINKIYKKSSFDAVIALDIIEHFEKKEAIKLIRKMEKISRKKVILLTPNGYLRQDPIENNQYQIHKSGWSKEELEKLGYKVYGLRGLKYIRGKTPDIKYKPYFLWGLLSFLSEIILFKFPSLSFDLFAVKKIKI